MNVHFCWRHEAPPPVFRTALICMQHHDKTVCTWARNVPYCSAVCSVVQEGGLGWVG